MDNSAFVFIKPHANTPATQEMVKADFASRGIEIVAEGELTGEEIDAGMLIDQHYYAIASKATLLKPAQLPIPADKFEDKFGLSWESALASGKVYNALDACAYFGIDADGLDSAWAKAKKANKLVKFGGGFYCGMVDTIEGKEGVYVFNGFFMSMRSKFVLPNTSIHYYVVEWSSAKLPWSDFRGKVLGPTDPADAPADSIRGKILSSWQALGLSEVPNTGDNGVHASASPFEALAERMNWLKGDLTKDSFGAKLLAAGVSADTIKEWSVDPQVKGKSLFDQLEDMDTAECVSTAVSLAPKDNSAFVFIKPHANTPATQEMVKADFASRGIEIVAEGELTGEEIDAGMLIDQHYYAIASKATLLKPAQLPIPADKFEDKFGLSWESALASGKVYNALDACAYFGIDADGLDSAWAKAKKANKLVKFGGGFYCGMVDTIEGKEGVYVFNGFFMSMRSKFVLPNTSIHYYVVEWSSAKLPWSDFRGKVLGPTDPADAPADSVRGKILSSWQALGLSEVPNTGDNGVHASASPFEALAERMNWLKGDLTKDSFGAKLLAAGVSADTIKEWSVDPQVKGKSLFDQLEDMDTAECVSTAVSLAPKDNSAFVFIKPHANTPATQEMVKADFASRGIEIVAEGELTGEEIDAGMLIDQHYYAIASKATLLKPAQLPIPADKFEDKFGLSWESALASGKVYNALDACAYFGIDADGLDSAWAKAKKANKLVKFGGGFYCGMVDTIEGKEGVYVFNGFFMSMRSKFVLPNTSIHYYVVEWSSAKLPWSDFRGKVLGPTDPADAPADSVRGKILSSWQALGLSEVPNTGDNGVHASASPFEALAERMNWLKGDLTKDSFGAKLLAAGVSADTIKEWSVDPQVKGKSLFDQLEDMDTAECVSTAVTLAN